jgi:hypothetical protein
MLEMMAFMYSVALDNNRPVSVERIAKAVIDVPGGAGKDPEGAVAKDLVRKFNGTPPVRATLSSEGERRKS